MGITRITLLLSLGASFAAAEAALDAPPTRAEAAATVTVTAEAAPVEIDKTPNPVKVLDAEAIQASGAHTLDELLPELLPGQLQPYGGPGTSVGLYLGGGRAQDVVVLLDGIRITDPSNMNPSFSDFSLEGIERVEVLQGPASARYGSDTHGGVVALYSSAPAKDGLSGAAMLGVGSRDARLAQVSPALGWGHGWVKASVSSSQEEQSNPTDEPFRAVSSALNLGERIGEDGLLTMTYRNHYRGTPLPWMWDYSGWPPARVFESSREETERDQNFIAAYRQTLGSAWLLEMSYGHVSEDRMEPGMYSGAPSDRYRGQRNQALGSLTWTPWKGLQGNLLLDYCADSADMLGSRAEGSHRAVALEMAYEWAFGLRVVASGRYQGDTIDYTDATWKVVPEQDSHRFVYKAGLNWLLKNGLRFYASYGTSYNTPMLYDLAYNHAKGYENLGNETSHGGQAGISYQWGAWSAKVEVSRTLYDQVIHYVDLGYPDYKYANGTNLRVQGVEGSLAYSANGWRLEGFLRNQEARNMSEPEDRQLTTQGATGRPFFSGGLRASVNWDAWRLSGRWAYTGSSYQYFDDLGGVEGERTHFNDLALSLGWSYSKTLVFELRGTHLMQKAWSKEDWLSGRLLRKNDAYLLPVFPLPGPTCTLEAKYRF